MTYWCTVLKVLLLLCVVLPILEPKSGIAMATVYNNPGNIEAGQGYAGETGETYGKGRFAVFSSPEMGLRALAYDLRSKMNEFDGDVSKVISKYAPANENKTKQYIDYVKGQIGGSKITDKNLAKAVAAVVRMENSDVTEATYLGKDLDNFSMVNEAIELSRLELDTSVNLQTARERLRGSRIDAIPTPPPLTEEKETAPLIVDADREKRVIGRGDTLTKIAEEQGMSIDQLLAMNPEIEDPDLIRTGQELTVRKPEKKGLFGMGFVIPGTGIGFNEGGDVSMRRQMDLFDEGGLKDEGGSVDPFSGNDVPVGSLEKEVRDDIPAQLSEGEFVFPADVVRYFGLETLMKMRQKAKAGLQRMEDMGQMGNSDQAVLPDDIPFDISDLELEDDMPMMMQVGGLVDDPYLMERREEEADVPRVVPTYRDLMGTSGGGSAYTTELRPYVNDVGVVIQIPFYGGQPLYPIPAGFFPQPIAPAQEQAQQTTTTTTATQQQDDDGDGQAEAQVAAERARYNKIQDTKSKLGITGGGGFNIGALLPFGLGDDMPAIGGRKQTMGPPTEEVMKARELAMSNLQVAVTGNVGNEPGDLDAASGGIFNIHGVAIDPFTGEAVGKGADASYGSRENFGNVIAAGNESGWRGGFIGNKNTNAYRTLNETQKEKYDNFLEALNTKTGVPNVLPTAPPAGRKTTTPVGQMGALGFEGQPLTSGAIAPDFTPFATGPFTTEGPQYPSDTFTGGIGTGDMGTAAITQPMEPLNYPQVPVVEQRQSPVVPAIMTRPTGDMMSLPQSKPTPEELYEYNFGTSGVPDVTGTGRIKTPEIATNLGQDPLTVTGQQEMTPTEIAMLQGGLERVDEPQSPIFAQSPVLPTFRNTGETMAMPTPADEVARLRESQITDDSFTVQAEAERDISDTLQEQRARAAETARLQAQADAEAERARAAESARLQAQADAKKKADQERARAAEAARLQAQADAKKKADQERARAAEAARLKAQAEASANKHGFKDKRVRDDQGTATKVENNKVYYSDDHDWSKPTQTTVREEKDDSDSGGGGKIVCTEMYRQTQLDDWKQAIKIWGVYEKKYLTPYHEKGYHWLFKPWVTGMQSSTTLTSVGAYLAKARTQHLKHIMTKGKAQDNYIGNMWCKVIHPIVYITGRILSWQKK